MNYDCVPMTTCDAAPVPGRPNMTLKMNDIRELVGVIKNQQCLINRHFLGDTLRNEQNANKREINCFASCMDDVHDILRELIELQGNFMDAVGVDR